MGFLQGDPEYVAREKCRLAADIVKGAVMVEDSGLCFNALGGLPGIYVKWFLDVSVVIPTSLTRTVSQYALLPSL